MSDHFELPRPAAPLAARIAAGGAVAWSEPVVIPTYEPAPPDRYPMFLSRRVYQGSSGRVYPIPFVDRIATEATPREWQAVHLENRWLRLMVLPELGGRIQVGFDKSAQYDFFYRNTVIKPALVGLAGPWVSGGVEFNWPQHHRPATFLPVDVQIEEHADGAVTVWCSDHDPFTRMKGMHGVRLHPDRAVVDLVVRLHNRTSEEQTFLWWANVAARVHDDYQSFFPTDVEFVADHARRAITRFPAADRPYYGVDYPSRAPGADRLDFYRNIPVPTSYMILDTADDFFGGYDHAAHAGFVHVADRRIAPGKKQWTWGDAAFGHAWDDLLTDSDGPYVELMAGVYTDNQPDFSWLAPGETKSFTQTWYPIQQIGVVHQANLECAVHLEAGEGIARLGVAVTAERDVATVVLRDRASGETLHSWAGVLAPGQPHVASVAIGDRPAEELELEVSDAAELLLRWSPRPRVVSAVEPEPATEPPRPADMASVDELYLTGLHLLQYRHPTRSPLPYWREALERDPGDARCNLALADHHYRDGNLVLARQHAERALARLTRRNANPRDGEASYLLGLILRRLALPGAAYDHFAKAAWDAKWSHPAHVELARLDASSGRDLRALEHVRAALATGTGDSRATALEVVLLRRLGHTDEASARLAARLVADPLDQLARALADQPLGRDPRTLIDIALELASFGEAEHALALLARVEAGPVLPIALYHRALILDGLDRPEEADSARHGARRADAALCFPHGLDDQVALERAIAADPDDLRAHALIGMLLADRDREHDALAHWLVAIDGGLSDPVVLRNAAIATYNVHGDLSAARELFERAIELAPTDARLWYESDQLVAIAGGAPGHRLERLASQLATVLTRDDLTIEWCDLLTAVGRAEEALEVLTTRRFAPWEGGEGRALAAWDAATLALAERALAAGRAEEALELADCALSAPRSLGEARHPLAPTDHIEDVRARALEHLGRACDAAAARSRAIPAPVANSGPEPDYFATSLPELLLFDWPRSPLRG
jgi:tetratricopeptide (TPR) repeat protein